MKNKLYSLMGLRFIYNFAFILIIILNSCAKKEERKSGDGPKILVQVYQLKEEKVSNYIYSYGKIQAYSSVKIKPRVSGQINQVLFQAGSDVKKGDILVTLDTERIKESLDRDEASLKSAKTKELFLQHILELDVKLVKNGAISVQEFEGRKFMCFSIFG